MTPIAERTLTYRDDADREHPFSVKVHPPKADGAFWACGYELDAPVPFTGTAYGEDSLQALVMALFAVQAHLSAPDLRDRVRWLGEPLTELLSLPAP
jgi:hypothetical protein